MGKNKENIKILMPENPNPIFKKIVKNINRYLENSKDTLPEFSVIKEIVSQDADTLEEDIQISIYSPLYIGLMGTIIGVVFGVVEMVVLNKFDINDTSGGINHINNLLLGVGVAMTASFIGLLLSLINALYFRKNRKQHFRYKNDFLNYVRIDILPSYSYRDKNSISSLHKVINNFSKSLTEKLDRLQDFYDKNNNYVIEQQKLFEQIDKLDVASIANTNLNIVKEFNKAVEPLQKLSKSLENVNDFVESSSELTANVNVFFDKYREFEADINNAKEKIINVANNINEKIIENTRVINFIEQQFDEIQHRRIGFDTVIDHLENHITTTLQNLEQNKNKELSTIINNIDEVDNFLEDSLENLKIKSNETLESFNEKLYDLIEILSNTYDEVTKALSEQLLTLKDNSKEQTEFIAQEHKTVVEKFDKQLEKVNENIKEKIEAISEAVKEYKQQISDTDTLKQIEQKLSENLQNQKELSEIIKQIRDTGIKTKHRNYTGKPHVTSKTQNKGWFAKLFTRKQKKEINTNVNEKEQSVLD